MARDKPFNAAGKSAQSVPAPKGKSTAVGSSTGVSDELRQAVMDLGGDEEDMKLISGVDDDAEGVYTGAPGAAMKSTEKDIKKALGEFMKGLDFKAAGADRPAEESEEEEDEDEEEAEEEDDHDEEEEDDDDEKEEEEEKPLPIAPLPKSKTEARKPVLSASVITPSTSTSDPSPTSATLVPPTPDWSSLLPPLPTSSEPTPPLPQFKLQGLRSKAETLLTSLPPLNRKSSSADAAFINQVLTSGTHQDKLAALTLLVRESPVHSVKELGRLRGMTGYKEDAAVANEGRVGAGAGGNKDQRVAVCKALVDWWVSGGGKSSGKLKYFADQPQLGHPDLTDRHLLMYAFEDFLKRWFFNLLQVLEVLAHDPLVYIRTQALQMVFRLLQGNAEQEQNLLRLGANKLGDTDKSVASKTSHLLLSLLQVHPAMKSIIAREVSSLVLKPSAPASSAPASSGAHVRFDDAPSSSKSKSKTAAAEKSDAQSHARYYGLVTLNQITLARGDQDLAGRLVDLYFEIFREILGEENNKDEEGGDKKEGVEKVTGKVGKWEGRRKKVGGKKGGKGGGKETREDDMEGVDARLVAAVLTGINRAVPYAKLDDAVFTGYMQSLFRITHMGTFNTSIQSLSLIFQVSQSAQSSVSSSSSTSEAGPSTSPTTSVTDRFYRTLYDSLFDSRLLTSSKQAMYLNLLFRALKADKEINRVMAFVKRLCQMFGSAGVPFLSGALYLLGELFSTTPGLKRMLIEPEDDGEERFVDAPEEGQAAKEVVRPDLTKPDEGYDGKKREPLYAKAETSCLWEILPLTTHYHPSISLLSTQLLLSSPLSGSPDIGQNTLISFLDKFVYRNPKKNVAQKGASVMQPAAGDRTTGSIKNQKGVAVTGGGTVNSEAFWRKKVEDVPVDQLFFHKFFSNKLALKDSELKKKKKREDEMAESGDEEAESDMDEDEVWKAMQASMPGADDLAITDSEGEDDENVNVDYSSDEEEEEGEDIGVEESGDELVDPAMDSDDEVDIDDEDEEDEEVDIDDDEDEEGVELGSEDYEEDEEDEGEDGGDNDGFPDLDSEEEDLIPLDEMPDVVLNASPSPEPEAEDVGAKRKRDNKERKELRKKRKEMPLFGDYEEWQKVIEEGGNEGED